MRSKFKFMESFIKNEKILEEDYKTNDLLNFSEIVNSFRKKLEQISENSIVGLIGKFGTGKSTMLYQLYKEQKRETDIERWINFDAWKYPERKELWEGFVLEIARDLDKKLFDTTRKKIDGEQSNNIRNLIKVIFQGANFFMPGASIGENFANLFKTSPVRRIFEFQEILNQIIVETRKNIYIIIEDIDRSGDRGIFFLETLKNFIKENQSDKKIIIIVPIGETQRKEEGNFKDSYDKVLDYDFYFNPENIDFTNFIKEIFNDAFISNNDLYYFNYLFKLLVGVKNLTLRELKAILRLSNVIYKKLNEADKKNIDLRLWIVFTCVYKFQDHILVLVNDKKKVKSDFWAKSFFIMIANNIEERDIRNYSDVPFFIVKDDNLITPKIKSESGSTQEQGYYLSDKYLELIK